MLICNRKTPELILKSQVTDIFFAIKSVPRVAKLSSIARTPWAVLKIWINLENGENLKEWNNDLQWFQHSNAPIYKAEKVHLFEENRWIVSLWTVCRPGLRLIENLGAFEHKRLQRQKKRELLGDQWREQ